MKILALDLGDKWVGSALSDALGITSKPFQTVEIEELEQFLQETLEQEPIGTVVIGNPITMGTGGKSEQTLKVEHTKEELEKKFGEIQGRTITWVLWDERLSSKRADQLKGGAKSKEEKKRQHSVAASFILQSYLDFLAQRKI